MRLEGMLTDVVSPTAVILGSCRKLLQKFAWWFELSTSICAISRTIALKSSTLDRLNVTEYWMRCRSMMTKSFV